MLDYSFWGKLLLIPLVFKTRDCFVFLVGWIHVYSIEKKKLTCSDDCSMMIQVRPHGTQLITRPTPTSPSPFTTCCRRCNFTASASWWILKAFFMNQTFYCRELGWGNSKGVLSNIKYKMPMHLAQLTAQDRVTANYVIRCIHGLTFCSDPIEESKP